MPCHVQVRVKLDEVGKFRNPKFGGFPTEINSRSLSKILPKRFQNQIEFSQSPSSHKRPHQPKHLINYILSAATLSFRLLQLPNVSGKSILNDGRKGREGTSGRKDNCSEQGQGQGQEEGGFALFSCRHSVSCGSDSSPPQAEDQCKWARWCHCCSILGFNP